MKAKSKLGMGLAAKLSKLGVAAKKKSGTGGKNKHRKRTVNLKSIITAAKVAMRPGYKAVESALAGARAAARRIVKNARMPRVIPVPDKIGGFLPFLIPILAGLSATGALAGGAAGIAKAVNEASANKHRLNETKRHNTTMEAIALGKGLYLRPYRSGMGLYLRPAKN